MKMATVHIHPEDGNHSVCQNVGNTQHSMRLTPKSQRYTLNTSCENLRTRITSDGCSVISKCAPKTGPFNYKATAPRIGAE
jgi:hypothetical protein